ncbi:hypothetical protein LCGC14_0613990 [marine sediment metagenome]|uniref:Uncharacterized protein n=1 Tax=marine sediment metagenome TaxID=412755 RepID=A0A0F9RBP4_9ZZZZ
MTIICKICGTKMYFVREDKEICYDCKGMMEAFEEISKLIDFKELGPIKIFEIGYKAGYEQGAEDNSTY